MGKRYFLSVTGHDVIAENTQKLYTVDVEVSKAEFERHIKSIREQVEKKGLALEKKGLALVTSGGEIETKENNGATVYEVQKAGEFLCSVGWVNNSN